MTLSPGATSIIINASKYIIVALALPLHKNAVERLAGQADNVDTATDGLRRHTARIAIHWAFATKCALSFVSIHSKIVTQLFQ